MNENDVLVTRPQFNVDVLHIGTVIDVEDRRNETGVVSCTGLWVITQVSGNQIKAKGTDKPQDGLRTIYIFPDEVAGGLIDIEIVKSKRKGI